MVSRRVEILFADENRELCAGKPYDWRSPCPCLRSGVPCGAVGQAKRLDLAAGGEWESCFEMSGTWFVRRGETGRLEFKVKEF